MPDTLNETQEMSADIQEMITTMVALFGDMYEDIPTERALILTLMHTLSAMAGRYGQRAEFLSEDDAADEYETLVQVVCEMVCDILGVDIVCTAGTLGNKGELH